MFPLSSFPKPALFEAAAFCAFYAAGLLGRVATELAFLALRFLVLETSLFLALPSEFPPASLGFKAWSGNFLR